MAAGPFGCRPSFFALGRKNMDERERLMADTVEVVVERFGVLPPVVEPERERIAGLLEDIASELRFGTPFVAEWLHQAMQQLAAINEVGAVQ